MPKDQIPITQQNSNFGLLLWDIVGYSNLDDTDLKTFHKEIVPKLVDYLKLHGLPEEPLTINTWGDACVIALSDTILLAKIAVAARNFFVEKPYANDNDILKHKDLALLSIRIAIHHVTGTVYNNPFTGKFDFFGQNCILPSRLEPATTLNCIFCSEEFKMFYINSTASQESAAEIKQNKIADKEAAKEIHVKWINKFEGDFRNVEPTLAKGYIYPKSIFEFKHHPLVVSFDETPLGEKSIQLKQKAHEKIKALSPSSKLVDYQFGPCDKENACEVQLNSTHTVLEYIRHSQVIKEGIRYISQVNTLNTELSKMFILLRGYKKRQKISQQDISKLTTLGAEVVKNIRSFTAYHTPTRRSEVLKIVKGMAKFKTTITHNDIERLRMESLVTDVNLTKFFETLNSVEIFLEKLCNGEFSDTTRSKFTNILSLLELSSEIYTELITTIASMIYSIISSGHRIVSEHANAHDLVESFFEVLSSQSHWRLTQATT